ncbi:ParA family protein [uncultured Thermanaerothrix sp.]|uniref:ParA family protein n=1 Tax=uncultured Thermanaerothrix sp. TaxID=1195149 RepID=UPI00260D3674|nr:ParA family protein [uncultured Thermanaerothrix sp.]
MGRTLAIVNQKGGVAKTTTCLSLGACLAEQGRRVLLIDLDPQMNLSVCAGVRDPLDDGGIVDWLAQALGLRATHPPLVPISLLPNGLHLLPGDPSLVTLEQRLLEVPSYELGLRKMLNAIASDYEYVLVDCSPSLGPLTIMALTAAQHVVIPVPADYLAAWGLMQLITTIEAVKGRTNPSLDYSLLCVMFDRRNGISHSMLARLRASFSDRLWKMVIGLDTRVREAAAAGEPILRYAPKSRAAQHYRQWAQEILAYFEASDV